MEINKLWNVLSLFNGINSGRISLDKVGIKVNKYYSSEIDKYANIITEKNYPDTIQLGDITKWKDWDIDWSSIDLVIGGSPCQSFSYVGNNTGFSGKSGLFFEFADITHNVLLNNPNAFFLLENVVMKKQWKDIITNIMGVKPIEINSNLVSAQNRRRLYWTNIPNVQQPQDEGILFKDILEDLPFRKIPDCFYKKWGGQQRINKSINWVMNSKANTLTTKNCHTSQYLLNKDKTLCRLLTPNEYEKLQTLPLNYTEGISNSERFKAIGNGWTIDVITHIFSNLK